MSEVLTVDGREMVTAIDISVYQPSPNFQTVKDSGVSAVWTKATEGTGYRDKMYASNRDQCNALGIPFGAYIFPRREVSAQAQADFFLDFTSNLAGNQLPPQIDFENAGNGSLATSEQVLTIASIIEQRTGLRPIIYMGSFLNPSDGRPAALGEYDLWLPAYPSYSTINPDPRNLKLPPVRVPWGEWTIWQYAGGNGRCPGITPPASGCDRNVVDKLWFERVLGRSPSTPREEPEVEASDLLLVANGGIYITQIFTNPGGKVTGSHRAVHVADNENVKALVAFGTPIREASPLEIDTTEFVGLPETPLTPEQIQAIADAVNVEAVDPDALANRVADVLAGRLNG